MTRRAALLGLLVLALSARPSLAADPPVPVGEDPGGTAVAVLTYGIDYTLPPVAARLARDGEGEIIAWDFVDGDNRPYAAEPDMYDVAMAAMLSGPDIRIVPIRVATIDPLWLARAAAFAERTPAEVLIVPVVAVEAELAQLAAVSRRIARLQFVVIPAGEINTERVVAAAADLSNVSVLGPAFCAGGGGPDAVRAVAAKLCGK